MKNLKKMSFIIGVVCLFLGFGIILIAGAMYFNGEPLAWSLF